MSKIVDNLLDKLEHKPIYRETTRGEVTLEFMDAYQLQAFFMEVRKQGVKYGMELAKLAEKPEPPGPMNSFYTQSEIGQFELELKELFKKYKANLSLAAVKDMPGEDDPSYLTMMVNFHSRRFPIHHSLGRYFPK